MPKLAESPLAVAARCVEDGRPAALATVISADGSTPRQAGAKMVVFPDGRIVGSVGGGKLELDTIQAAVQCLVTGAPARVSPQLTDDLGMCCGGRVEVFVEPLVVSAPAYVYGAGHVAHAVVALLQHLNFRVTVVDDRADLLTEERFVGCTLAFEDPIAHASRLPDDPRAHVLVMTHDHLRDVQIVTALSGRSLGYLGMLGAKAKRRHLERHLSRSEGADPSVLDRIKAPIGLDIGAMNPAEIAVAIAAEIIAVRRGTVRGATGSGGR